MKVIAHLTISEWFIALLSEKGGLSDANEIKQALSEAFEEMPFVSKVETEIEDEVPEETGGHINPEREKSHDLP